MEIQIFEYLKDEKRFLHEIKNIFKVFKGVSLGEKLKKKQTQTLNNLIVRSFGTYL